jgi:hypothetical protein
MKMGLDMYLISVPKIEEMNFDEILLANAHLHQHEVEQNEIYYLSQEDSFLKNSIF